MRYDETINTPDPLTPSTTVPMNVLPTLLDRYFFSLNDPIIPPTSASTSIGAMKSIGPGRESLSSRATG